MQDFEEKKCRIFFKKKQDFYLKKKRGAFTSVDNLDGCENGCFYI
jgi:hypothetical protein